jgi:short-subunit dehydrogenase
VIGYTDSARLEYRRAGVKFSVVMPTFVNTELIAGTSGAKGVKNAEPADVADAIVKLVAHPRPRVRVTRTAGAIIASQKFMPRALSEGLNRSLGGEHVFTDDIDIEKRKAYEARARGEE